MKAKLSGEGGRILEFDFSISRPFMHLKKHGQSATKMIKGLKLDPDTLPLPSRAESAHQHSNPEKHFVLRLRRKIDSWQETLSLSLSGN